MDIVRGNNFLMDGILVDSKKIGQYVDPGSVRIYEVLRVGNSNPLFLSEHIDRLKLSVLSIGEEFSDIFRNKIEKWISEIIEKTNIIEGNIKITLQFQNKEKLVFIYFIPHFYPPATDYKNGVELGLYNMERDDPNVKKVNSVRDKINSYIAQNNLYEVLLVNHVGEITEGSRSNVFFIDTNNAILTAPDRDVLLGITRKYALRICDDKGFKVKYQPVKKAELGEYKTAFLTGTSPKILPIKKIENVIFDVNSSVLRTIMNSYDEILNNR